VLKGQGVGEFCFGPVLSPEGVGVLGTGLVPEQLKGQEGPRSFKAEEAVPVFFQIPLMTGNVPLKASVLGGGVGWARGDFPQSREGGMFCSVPWMRKKGELS
jgi:hypothetical protein